MYDAIEKVNQDIRERFLKLERRIRKNEYLSAFYETFVDDAVYDYKQHYQLSDSEFENNGHLNFMRYQDRYFNHVCRSAYEVGMCSRWFDVDYYPFQGVKDINRTFTCDNKFCDGCQSALSQQRYEKFAPVLDALSETHTVAHVVLTVPNCYPSELKATLDNMYEQRKYLIRYLNGSKRIRGINFEKYGFHGGVVALEVTRNADDGKFHPHFHCVMVFDKNPALLYGGRKHVNSYSFKRTEHITTHKRVEYGKPIRYFNDFEVLLQKVWRLRIDHVEVNRHTIADLKEGYSCIVEHRDNFHEVFKYATKGVLKYNEDVDVMLGNRSDFLTLDYALYSRRLIQSYGCLRGIPIPDTVDQSAANDALYENYVKQLRFLEDPIKQRELLADLLADQKANNNIKYISRKNIKAIVGGDDGE